MPKMSLFFSMLRAPRFSIVRTTIGGGLLFAAIAAAGAARADDQPPIASSSNVVSTSGPPSKDVAAPPPRHVRAGLIVGGVFISLLGTMELIGSTVLVADREGGVTVIGIPLLIDSLGALSGGISMIVLGSTAREHVRKKATFDPEWRIGLNGRGLSIQGTF